MASISLFLPLAIVACPFAYYLLAIYGSLRFFLRGNPYSGRPSFTPPVSNLKPVKGLDAEAYENFASLCRQDYPEYELLFCVDEDNAAVLAALEKLKAEFPQRSIRVFLGSGRAAPNDKVAKLARLVEEARYEYLVINDSDVRARPDYFRTVIQPLADRRIGAVTLPYVPLTEDTFADRLQWIGMHSDFYAGILVARLLDGVKFALGPTVATTREQLARFGGYGAIENQPGDDLLIGRLVAGQGFEVELLPNTVETVADFASLRDLVIKRLRWMTVMRHMRPLGHLGLIFTQGLVWAVVAAFFAPSAAVGWGVLAAYFVLRSATTLIIGRFGLKQRSAVWGLLLIPVWDTLAFAIWLASFTRRSVRWRGCSYYIRNGCLVPAQLAEKGAD